ncbi:MAG: DEAD/DEAH box helicase, partial [Bdellovibrionales bacterium]|nr:DEAD/DEAH box helicase [Bdellovibrionales bacterium]
MKFEELNLNSDLKASIQKLGFTDCTDIQEAAFDPIVSGKDVAGLSQTGSGKTAAFLIPLIERIYRSREENSTRGFKDWKSNSFILVLVPTRELAEQVLKNLDHLTTDEKIRAVSVYGGVSYDKQKSLIAEGVEFVIATPGRLIDLHKEHVINLSNVKAIVFDEADRMFDMGFKDDMRYILQRIPLERQYLVFSATLNFDVLNVAYEFGSNPLELNISRENTKAEQVNDHILHVGQEDKPKFLLSILKKTNPEQVIVFSNF